MARRSTRLICFLAGVGLIFTHSASAADLTNRYVVKGNGGAAIPYDSLAKAAADIQTAINYAYAGETVLVAAATYDTGGTNAGRYVTNRVYISKAVTVRGIDNNPATTVIKGAWDPNTNGWLAVRCVYMVAGSSLIGFTLSGGATISSNEVDRNIIAQDACGGGVCAWGTTSATISNCIITGNTAWGDRAQSGKYGAGVCDGTYFNCTIAGNSIFFGGNGAGAESAILSNCTIAGNSAGGSGGGSQRGTLYGCLVSNNTAGSGGGLYGWNAAAPCRAFNCTIITNKATNAFGGGAAGGSGQLSVTLSNCTVALNSAVSVGGGADLSILYNCFVISNYSAIGGGGTARSTLTNCIVAYNINGGSRYNTKVRNTLYYGNNLSAIYVRDGDIIESCTFVGNNTGISLDQAATVAVVNCISYSNTVNWTTNSVTGAFLAFSNSCTFPEYPGWDATNITNEPLFMAYGSGFGLSHVPGNYRLQAISPCINTGTNQDWMTGALDLDNLPRILRSTVDRGAYEAAHVFNYAPAFITNTVMRGYLTNMTVYLTNTSPDLQLYWASAITSAWASGPSSGAPIAISSSGTLTVTNNSLGLSPITYVSRMIVSALTNYPSAMAGYAQTGVVDMVLHVAEFARNPTQVTATVNQFACTNTLVSIWNNGSGDIPYSVQTNVSWLAVEPSSGVLTGSTAQALNVNFTNTSLPLGVHYGTLTLVPGISGVPFEINVELTVTTGPRMTVNPLLLSGSVMMGQNLTNQYLKVSNVSTAGNINCRVNTDKSWLTVSPSNSIVITPLATNTLTVSYQTSGLMTNVAGQSNYNAVITITATNTDVIGSPAEVAVTLTVNPKARLDKNTILITNIVTEGYDAPSKTFEVWNGSGYYALNYSLSDNVDWFVLTPSSGTSSGEHDTVTAEFSTARLSPGISNAVITIVGRSFDGMHSDSSVNSTQHVDVRILVTPLASLATDAQGEYEFSARYGHSAGSGSFRVWNLSTGGGVLEYLIATNTEWLSVTPVSGTSGGEMQTVAFSCRSENLRPGKYSGLLTVSGIDQSTGTEANNSPTNISVELFITANSGFDFAGDGSGASDLVVYKETTGLWNIRNLLSGFTTNIIFGGSGYVPTPGDFDGDGASDLGVYRYASGYWYIRKMADQELAIFGGSYWAGPKLAMSGGFTPVAGDYDGDGLTDPAMYNEKGGLWSGLFSGSGYAYISGIFGGPGYVAIPADYDADGLTDPAVYNETTAQWYVLYSSDGYRINSGIFGGPGYTAAPADYDGDGKADGCVYMESTGLWIILPSSTLSASGYVPVSGVFGGPGFVPVPADYTGDGMADAAVYDEATGNWYIVAIDGSRVAWPVQHGGYGYLPVKP
jgi:hypothetical protein